MKRMEKKIEDYLHLYLGCEVVGTGKKPGTKHYTLVGATFDGGCLFKTIPEGFSIDLGHDWKPILRPLSSMTEEEFKTVSGLLEARCPENILRKEMKKEGHTWIRFYVVKNDEEVIYGNVDNSKDGIHYYRGNNYYRCYVSLIPYLLSKHFDLFGLIESGLAIPPPSDTAKQI